MVITQKYLRIWSTVKVSWVRRCSRNEDLPRLMVHYLWNPAKINGTLLICERPTQINAGERGGSVVERRIPEREVGRHFTPRKYW